MWNLKYSIYRVTRYPYKTEWCFIERFNDVEQAIEYRDIDNYDKDLYIQIELYKNEVE